MEAKEVILAVGAHPDDIDVVCGGTIAKLASEGADIYYLILTDGSKGHEDYSLSQEELVKIRKQEQQAACQVLGVKETFCLDFVDGELENSQKLRKLIVKIVREIKPNVVITLDPTFVYDSERGRINHPDHRIAGQATLDAVFPFARNSRTFPELLEQGFEPHVVKEVLLASTNNPNFFIDVTKTFSKKLTAIKKHCSQFNHPSPEEVCHRMTERAEKAGQKAGVQFAESFAKITLSF